MSKEKSESKKGTGERGRKNGKRKTCKKKKETRKGEKGRREEEREMGGGKGEEKRSHGRVVSFPDPAFTLDKGLAHFARNLGLPDLAGKE